MGKQKNRSNWTSFKFSKNMLIDALTRHLLGLAYYRMTDIGEVLDAVSRSRGSDEESWISSWADLANGLQERAMKAEKAGHTESAASTYLRASTYWRASLMYYSNFSDRRIRDYSISSSLCYERYIQLSDYPGEYVEIPYENSFLPGHFYRSPVAGEKAPVLIITPGRDTWAEDTRWVYDGAIRRGIHCLVYDGPGQGFALRLNKLHFRPDWENVIGPVIDYASQIEGVDTSRIGLMGLSFGGFLVPRAAAFDKRIKVLITDPGNISWGTSIIRRLEKMIKLPELFRPSFVNTLIQDYAWKHGVPESRVIETLKQYDNSAIIDRITCLTLVLDGTAEILPGKAMEFFKALQCPKEYMLFDDKSTAQCHCQMGGYATANEYLFDWLVARL